MSAINRNLPLVLILSFIVILLTNLAQAQDDEQTRNVLKQGLVGAGAGALAAGTSGGNAGQGALVGAGTTIIGSALLDSITGPSGSSRRPAYSQDDDYYYTDDTENYYEAPPQQSASSQILKQGLVGAGAGALAAGTSGGDAGKGALIGAGTNVIGNALLDAITQPPQQRRGRVYRKIPKQTVQTQQEESTGVEGGRKKVIKKYDENGKLVSEEETYY